MTTPEKEIVFVPPDYCSNELAAPNDSMECEAKLKRHFEETGAHHQDKSVPRNVLVVPPNNCSNKASVTPSSYLMECEAMLKRKQQAGVRRRVPAPRDDPKEEERQPKSARHHVAKLLSSYSKRRELRRQEGYRHLSTIGSLCSSSGKSTAVTAESTQAETASVVVKETESSSHTVDDEAEMMNDTSTTSRPLHINPSQHKSHKAARRVTGFQSIKPMEVPKDFKPPVFRKSGQDRDFLHKSLKAHFLFESLPERKLRTLALAAEKYDLEGGQAIMQQGEPSEHLFILREGSLRYEMDETVVDEADAGVIQAGPGKFLGELSFLHHSPASATVVAETRGRAFRIDFFTIKMILQDTIIQTTEEKVALLQGVHFFENVDRTTLEKCAAALQPIKFRKDEVIVDATRPVNHVYFIQAGQVLMRDQGGTGELYGDVLLGAGQCIGESLLQLEQPRPFSVTALSDGTAFGIRIDVFNKTIGNLGRLNRVARDVQTLSKIKTFQDSKFSQAELAGLAECIVETRVVAGAFLFQEGDDVECSLYLLYSGRVDLTNSRANGVESIEAGGFFGNEQITADSRIIQGDGSVPDDILDRPSTTRVMYSAKVLEDCVIGRLALKDCRGIVDTTKIGQKINRINAQFQSVMDDQITFSSLEKRCPVGSGTFGQVWLVSRQSKTYKVKNWYALKVQSKYQVVKANNVERIMAEKELLMRLRHPFVMTLRTTFQDTNLLYMLLDFLPGGQILDRIDACAYEGIPEADVAFYAACLFEAVKFLHGHRIMHRDIKPENVLLDHEGYPVLVDFGFAKRVDTGGKSYTFLGTPMYMAPELILNQGHDFACDIWSLGVCTYELLVGETPFTRMAPSHLDQNQLFGLICEGGVDFEELGGVSESAIELLRGLLRLDPVERPNSREIPQSKWFDDHGLDFGRLRRHEVRAPWIPDFDPDRTANRVAVDSCSEDMTTKVFPPLDPHDSNKLKFF